MYPASLMSNATAVWYPGGVMSTKPPEGLQRKACVAPAWLKLPTTTSELLSDVGSTVWPLGVETLLTLLRGRSEAVLTELYPPWDELTVQGPEGRFTGKGIILYQDTFSGQSYTRYEFTRGVALLRTGNLGCDLGGTCNLYFETPPFEHNGSRIQLRGRYYLTSPLSYRVTTEIAIDKDAYRNWGTVWYTKNEKAKPQPIR